MGGISFEKKSHTKEIKIDVKNRKITDMGDMVIWELDDRADATDTVILELLGGGCICYVNWGSFFCKDKIKSYDLINIDITNEDIIDKIHFISEKDKNGVCLTDKLCELKMLGFGENQGLEEIYVNGVSSDTVKVILSTTVNATYVRGKYTSSTGKQIKVLRFKEDDREYVNEYVEKCIINIPLLNT